MAIDATSAARQVVHARLPGIAIPALLLLTAAVSVSHAQQKDLQGPVGSGAFGTSVTRLPNGNFVVTDPDYSSPSASNVGAVYLFAPDGGHPLGTPISVLTGSSANDHVGSDGVVVLTNGNFIVVSTLWNNGAATGAGAVTWASGVSGVSGTVSAANSLVGGTANDSIGNDGVTALANGNYVVNSYSWSNGAAGAAGASTWGNGNSGVAGLVSAANSLVGTVAGDEVGIGSVALTNGNYVVTSSHWHNGALANAGAVTWANGATGIVGTISPANSLVGSAANDYLPAVGVTALSNGNYVVCSPWSQIGGASQAGAATFGDGSTGIVGTVTSANSLVGASANDHVGYFAKALTNGNYVVQSFDWRNPLTSAAQAGAATWGNGVTGVSGSVSSGNSLVGTTAGDQVGSNIVALDNGNYVVGSPYWSDVAAHVGAATLGDGSSGTSGTVSAANSLVGSTANDAVGLRITGLANGNYVVGSPSWNGLAVQVGAVTWGKSDGTTIGTVSTLNSLTGSASGDQVGSAGVVALSDGNYVVASPHWQNAGMNSAGAATWVDGTQPVSGSVSVLNSLVGSALGDQVSGSSYGGVTALGNGDYVVSSPTWSNGGTQRGAVTWGSGYAATVGPVSTMNSLYGSSDFDDVGYASAIAVGQRDYVVMTPNLSNGAIGYAGAVTLGRGAGPMAEPVTAYNSVLGGVTNGGGTLVWDYDAARDQLIVGRPAENIVTLFKADALFRGGFDVQ